ncbi:hypothetical protein IMZ29_00860 [Achromobacter sp. GG226]|uniref:hypothetical protein n=1 Tax=Verticiella alkaliphila TaxID=2779529 RepID=UPI001C0BA500|nr:hypothetical protein [Verticiella sp. GG226]MBU4609153.1 hypothetical protein [Verticiella sp. GG226]
MSSKKKQESAEHDDTTDGFARMVKDAQGDMRGYQMDPAMRAVAERCSGGRIVTMTSKIPGEDEARRVRR